MFPGWGRPTVNRELRHGRFDPCHTLVFALFTMLSGLIERLPEWRVPVDTLFVPMALWLQYSYEKYVG